MQDNRTGAIVEINGDALARLEELTKPIPKGQFKLRIADLMRDPSFVRKAGEASGIPAEYQGPVFHIDEELTIKGGKFRVRGFEGGMLHLEGLPVQ